MSLTSLLDDKSSALFRFMESEPPETTAVAKAYRLQLPAAEILRPLVPEGIKPAWGALNAAIDHRLRYSLSPNEPPGAVSGGVHRVDGAAYRAGEHLLAYVKRLLTEHRPHDRQRPIPLDPPAEEALDRACFVEAWFEEVFRTGRVWPGTPLADLSEHEGLEVLPAAVPDYAVQDIAAVAKLADRGLRVRATTTPEQVKLGPVFTGSRLVRGADADWIADGLLCDVKSTGSPEKLRREDVWQLAGYVLLDFDDDHSIQHVGWYASRLGTLATWSVADFLRLLAARRPVTDLRAGLMETLLALHA